MSIDPKDFNFNEFSTITPEQFAATMTALDIFNSYLLENDYGPGTRELLESALHDPQKAVEENATDIAAGLLAVAAVLSALWRHQGFTPQQIVESVREAFIRQIGN